MEDIQIRKDIDNINVNIETPHDDSNSNLHSLERDNWGRILNNKTFKLIKDNFVSVKSSLSNLLSNIINEVNNINTKNTELKNDVDLLKSSVEDIKTKGSKINEETINKLADKTKENTFNEINNFEKGINSKLINIDSNRLIEMQEDTINIGNTNKNINIIGKGNTLLYNGKEIEGGGSSVSSGGKGKNYILVETLPDNVVKFNSNNKPYFERQEFSNKIDSYYWQFQHTFSINKDISPFTRDIINTSNLESDIIKVNLESNGNYSNNANRWKIQSKSILNKFLTIFDIKNHTEAINIPNFVGISFKLNISIKVVNKDAPEVRYGVIETLINEEYFEKIDIVISNQYDSARLNEFYIRDIYNSYKHIKNISNFSISDVGVNIGATVMDLELEDNIVNKIKNYYNDPTKKLYIKLTFKEFKIIKFIENGSGGKASSGNVSDYSSSYGVNVIAYTDSYTSLPLIFFNNSIKKNIIEYDKTKSVEVLKGNIPLEVDNVNIQNRDTKPIIYMSAGDKKSLIIPCYYMSDNKGILLNIFNDNKSNIPIDVIYGVSFNLKLKIFRFNNDNSKKILIDENLKIEMRFIKGTSKNIEEIVTSNDNNIEYYVNGARVYEYYPGWFKILSIDLENNHNSPLDDMNVYFKLKKIGFYNLVSMRNTITNSIEKIKCYESIRIENAVPFIENMNDLRDFYFRNSIDNVKILLKI